MITDTAKSVRIRQALLLLAGALALELLVTQGSLRFYWTPLILGITYLAAAAAGGRRGSYWTTACVLVGWGLAVVYVGATKPTDIDTAGAYLVGTGLGAVAGTLFARRRFDVSPLGLGATAAAAGLILAISPPRNMTPQRTTRTSMTPSTKNMTIVAALLCALATPTVAAAADGQRLFGTGISREPKDTRRLTIQAEPTDGGAADGRVTFQHDNDPNGISRFKGTVTCLQITGAVAQISGTVTRGETAAGVILTGKQYAFTITLGDTQRFSLPRFAATIDPCSGGSPKTVAVTQGHYTTR